MEEMKVFGKQKFDFEVTENGEKKHIVGIKLHCTKDAPNDKWEGMGYESIFVPAQKEELYKAACSLPVGSTIIVMFNRYGKPDGFQKK